MFSSKNEFTFSNSMLQMMISQYLCHIHASSFWSFCQWLLTWSVFNKCRVKSLINICIIPYNKSSFNMTNNNLFEILFDMLCNIPCIWLRKVFGLLFDISTLGLATMGFSFLSILGDWQQWFGLHLNAPLTIMLNTFYRFWGVYICMTK